MAIKIKLLIGEKKLIKTKVGANIMEAGEKNLAEMIPLAKALGLPVYYYNYLSGIRNDANATLINSFLTQANAKLGLFYPIAKPVASDYLDWLVQTFPVEFIQLDQESISNPYSMTNAQYILGCDAVMRRYPDLKYSYDCGLIYRYTVAAQVERNKALAPLLPPPNIGRQYMQISDIVKFSANQSVNLQLIKDYFAITLPKYLADFEKQLPNLDQQSLLQWFVEAAGQANLSAANTNYTIGESLRFVLEHTESFSHIFFMQVAGLMSRGVASPEYNSLKRFVPATKFLYVVPLDIKIDGVTGIAVHDGVDSFGLLADNSTATEHTLMANEFKIFQKMITGIFVRDSGYATSLTSEIKNEIVADTQTKIKPFSTNYITFKTVAMVGDS